MAARREATLGFRGSSKVVRLSAKRRAKPAGLRSGGVFDAVDDRAAALGEALLEAAEAVVDRLPAGGDQIHQEREIVDACVALGEVVALDALEPSHRLVRKPANLGELTGDRLRLVEPHFPKGARQRAVGPRRFFGRSVNWTPLSVRTVFCKGPL